MVRSQAARIARVSLLFLAGVLFTPGVTAQAPASAASEGSRGVAIAQHGGYPELHVDGKPFFIHAGAFFYYRVPRDLWEHALDRYRALGINTIDISIPWNWHEPREGQFDFDGHTNPRCDLRALLRLITERGFRLIVRPGPQILNEWRHGGYPEWLLERPEYHMDVADRLEGRYPPFSGLNTHDAEAAAKELLENPTHMVYARKWLGAVAKELAPYSSSRVVSISEPTRGAHVAHELPGPLLFVQIEDDLAIGRTNRVGPNFWRYLGELRGMLEAGGLDAPVFINPTDMRVSAEGASLARPIGVMGQWYMQPGQEQETGAREFDAADSSTVEFFVEELKTQAAFPPVLVEFQAGWYCPGDDDRPLENPPPNTLLGSRLALAHGLHGLNNFPLEDTFTPAGYDVPWANRSYRWDAALNPNAGSQPRARAVMRNGQFLKYWGEWLAASHKRADFGIVYPLGSFPQEQLAAADIQHISRTVEQLERLGQLATLSSEVVDPEYQPVEQLLRHALLLFPVFDSREARFLLSEKSQRALVEYVRRGGTLIVFPSRPGGAILEQLWAAPASPGPSDISAIARKHKFGDGQVIESTKDFHSWVEPEKSFAQNLALEESSWATQVLGEFLRAADTRAVIRRTPRKTASADLIITELVSNEGTGQIGERKHGTGLLSVTNLSEDISSDEDIEVLVPGASAHGQGDAYLSMHVNVSPRESLLLPLVHPLCSGAPSYAGCHDAVASASAELLQVEREGKSLELTFYTPARATIHLRLERRPSHITLEETPLEGNWTEDLHDMAIEIPRGASPNFLRTIKVALPYSPYVTEKPKPHGGAHGGYEYSLADAVRLPLGVGSSIVSEPPLVVLNAGSTGQFAIQANNLDEEFPRDVSIKVEGPFHGTAFVRVPRHGTALVTVKLKTANGEDKIPAEIPPGPDGLIQGTVELRSKGERMSTQIPFLLLRSGTISRYQFDFDRDGAPEWALESTGTRLIVSPESGGRALALVDKDSGLDLISSVGGLRDNFAYAENPPGTRPERAHGRYGLFNRPYHAEWIEEKGTPALRMRYEAPDIFPAGAAIEKTVRLADMGEIRADYRIQLRGAADTSAAASQPAQAFVAVNSVPAVFLGNRSTRFCWVTASGEPKSTGKAPTHCETFVPEGAPLQLPADASGLEVRTPGQPGLELDWSCAKAPGQACGQMTIEMKNYSALLQLQFPSLTPGGAAGEYSVRFRVLPIDEAGAPE